MRRLKDQSGRFIENATWIERECIVCHKPFTIKESALKYRRGKYCSRKCCDEHKKKICIGKGNGYFGKILSEKGRRMRSDITAKSWKIPNIRKSRLDGIERFVLEHGYHPGADEKSKEKRKHTFTLRYGVPHNWMVKEVRKKCNDTCILRYGKSMWQLMMEALKFHQTEIEIITKRILDDNGITYKPQFQLWDGGNIRIYDYYIPSSNLLIELDGDFWHANPIKYPKEKLLEVQRANILNDEYKTNLAKTSGYKIERFWETRIKLPDYPQLLLHTIKQYENVTPTKENES